MSPSLGVYAMTRPASQLLADGTGDWRDQAACAGMTDDVFFGPEHQSGAQRRAREAAAVDICEACPVVKQCLTAALEAEGGSGAQHRFGVVGGMTPEQRVALSRGLPVPKLARPAPKPAARPAVDRDPRPRPDDCAEPSEFKAKQHAAHGERPCWACSRARTDAARARRAASRAANDVGGVQ